MKYFVNYSDTKETFKDLEEQYYKYIVFIEGSDLIYTHGHYYGDLKDAFEALKVEISDSIDMLKEQVNTTDNDLYNNIESLGKDLANNIDELTKLINSNKDSIQEQINTLVEADASTAINTFNEIVSFLEGIENSEDLDNIIASIEQQIANVNKSLEEHLAESQEIFITRLEVEDNYVTKTEVANNYQIKGNYALKSDLESSIPTKVSQLENDASYAYQGDIPTKVSEFENDANYATKSEIPTNLGQLTNDVNYAKVSEIPTSVSQLTNDSGFITIDQVPEVSKDLSQYDNSTSKFVSESELTGKDYATKDELPTVPTNVSAFTNDANYATTETLNQAVQAVNSNINGVNQSINTRLQNVNEKANKADATATDALNLAEGIQGSLSSFALKENVNALESQMITGDIKYIKKVTALPDSPDSNTLYIITA